MTKTFDTWYSAHKQKFCELVEAGASSEQLETFLAESYAAGYTQCRDDHLDAKPTAWRHVMSSGLVVYYHTKDYLDPDVVHISPLYALPPSREPLSEKQIDVITDRYFMRGTVRPQYQLYRAYIKAIEALHGIK